MVATDHSLAMRILGAKVIVHDGLDLPRLCDLLQAEPMRWLVAMRGMIEPLITAYSGDRDR